jgi:hypothetical protein
MTVLAKSRVSMGIDKLMLLTVSSFEVSKTSMAGICAKADLISFFLICSLVMWFVPC